MTEELCYTIKVEPELTDLQKKEWFEHQQAVANGEITYTDFTYQNEPTVKNAEQLTEILNTA